MHFLIFSSAKSFNIKALANPLLMAMCVNYLLVSVIRGACNDWGQMYLIKNKGQSLLAGIYFIINCFVTKMKQINCALINFFYC